MISPTRAAFLAVSAAALADCSKNLGSGILPSLSPSTNQRAPVATPAEAIPQRVLTSPIIGEGRRFDGATAPPGWIKLEGQRLPVSNYSRLASILGNGGSREPSTFVLPAVKLGWIVAIAGTDPGDVRAVAALHRGAESKLGVSVAGIRVSESPFRFAALVPAAPAVDKWFPGRKPTADEIEAAQRMRSDMPFRP